MAWLDKAGFRFIPACAGNSTTSPCPKTWRNGSSPRVRGTRHAGGHAVGWHRFIPACAGNSMACGNSSQNQPVHPRVCGELLGARGIMRASAGSSPRVRGTPSSTATRPTTTAVHPRVCGELYRNGRLAATSLGSSPRVRGTHRGFGRRRRQERFIPACAGNSARGKTGVSMVAVHPRVCGELPSGRPSASMVAGSSPRVRGTRHDGRMHGRRRRFIPACAGNSRRRLRCPVLRSVHPRVCGELVLPLAPPVVASGSSPRVRGTPRGPLRDRPALRFIPACAGNSAAKRAGADTTPVHPRVCGELEPSGSVSREPQRFIPACAGNSRLPTSRTCSITVHPRVCGELGADDRKQRGPDRFIPACAGNSSVAKGNREVMDGSSPRVRGTRIGVQEVRVGLAVHPRVCGELPVELERARPEQRFIPACAGNSKIRPTRWAPASVHPRVCGELLLDVRYDGRVGRFIPACAGNSGHFEVTMTSDVGSSPRVRGTRRVGGRTDRRRAVHPRVCGELPIELKRGPRTGGSSPRVRGTPAIEAACPSRPRFIPACAGNSRGDRLRGLQNVGSSPRVRGTRSVNARRRRASPVHPRVCGELDRHHPSAVLGVRFIPACAGNSRAGAGLRGLLPVHPRVCGELFNAKLVAAALAGSSPRVRGTRDLCHRGPGPHRFIPACAGNSDAAWESSSCDSVHPRVCGGTPRSFRGAPSCRRFIPACAGNSGRRGDAHADHRRFIPACAGNSRWRRCWWTVKSVHPRVCGELDGAPAHGPRAGRFIPACAGNSSWRGRTGSAPPVHPRVCGELAGR